MHSYYIIEGGDCCGKSTAATMLLDKLIAKGVEYFTTHALYDHPEGREAYEAMCRRDPIDQVRELMLISHKALAKEVVIPQLNLGKVVVQDRNWLSTINYQWINHGLDYRSDERLIEDVKQSYEYHKPFLILLDGDDDIIDARIKAKENKDANELESLDFHRKIRKQYRDLLIAWESWGFEGAVIKASSIDQLSDELDNILSMESTNELLFSRGIS